MSEERLPEYGERSVDIHAGDAGTGSSSGERPMPDAEQPVVDDELLEEPIDREPASEETPQDPAPQTGMLVDDEVAPGPGQIRKSAFLAELETAICAAAEREFEGIRWKADDCPWITHWFRYYHEQRAAHVAAVLRRYVPEVDEAAAVDYIPAVVERVRRGIVLWKKTGRVSELPDEATEDAGGSNPTTGVEDGSDDPLVHEFDTLVRELRARATGPHRSVAAVKMPVPSAPLPAGSDAPERTYSRRLFAAGLTLLRCEEN